MEMAIWQKARCRQYAGSAEQKMQKYLLVFLSTGLDYGGAETQLVNLATRLKQRGWDVRIISMLPPQAFREELEGAGIPVATLNMRRGVPDPRAAFKLVKILLQWKPHILTSFMFHANLLGRVAGRLTGVPVIVSSIRSENLGGPLRDVALRLTDWMSDITTVNSRVVASKLIKRRVVSQQTMRVIPNGLLLDKFTTNSPDRFIIRRELGVAAGEFLWLAVGRLEEPKDYPTLLRAFQILLREGCKSKLRIAGQGPLSEKLQQQAAEMGILGQVTFLGLRRDIPLLLTAADGFVLSSAWEGLPNAVMEGMAAAKPIVATRVGGVPELVIDGTNGYVVPPRDAEALAEAMRRMMALSDAERVRMGSAGRARIQADYTLDRVVDQWEELYRELLRRKGAYVLNGSHVEKRKDTKYCS